MSDKKSQESDIALRVEHISKSFRLPHEQASGLKQAFINRMRGIKGYSEQHVLRDISFEINKGDFFGIVGRNGSGKSTLLKLISQIYTPDKGKITVNGSLVPFIELGVGFNPELTGRENVYLNGAMLGFSKEEIEAMYDEIVEFAELHDFMDQKLKNYSSGMQVRLAFSVAIKAEADILVLDEILAVGDEAFQRKCHQYFAKLKKNKKTVILVTHDMGSVQQFCTRAMMVDGGKIIEIGNTASVAQTYRELLSVDVGGTDGGLKDPKNQPVDIKAKMIRKDNLVKISTILTAKEDVTESTLTLFLDSDTGEQVYRFSSDEKTGNSINLKQGQELRVDLELQDIFPNGIFTLRASVKSLDRTKEYALYNNLGSFEVDRRNMNTVWNIHWQPNETFEIR